MKKSHQIIAGVTAAFALAGGLGALGYFYKNNQTQKAVAASKSTQDKLKHDYDHELVAALRDLAMGRHADSDARIKGLLAAKFIYDSNTDDEVRQLLKEKKVDPHHYGSYELSVGDGFMNVESATQLARFLLANNIVTTAEPDRHNGQRQAEYINDGTDKRLAFYYQPAPSDYDGANKPWIAEQYKNIGPDSIYVPMSAQMGEFLHNLMAGKYNDIARYQVVKVPDKKNTWEIKTEKLSSGSPAAPANHQKTLTVFPK